MIDTRHVLLAENEVFLVYVEADRRLLIKVQYVFEVVDHVGRWTNDWKVLQQSHGIEIES